MNLYLVLSMEEILHFMVTETNFHSKYENNLAVYVFHPFIFF